jgi:ribosomal protein S27AE
MLPLNIDGMYCPKCGHDKFYVLESEEFICKKCYYSSVK